jgi:hypothetical protein
VNAISMRAIFSVKRATVNSLLILRPKTLYKVSEQTAPYYASPGKMTQRRLFDSTRGAVRIDNGLTFRE